MNILIVNIILKINFLINFTLHISYYSLEEAYFAIGRYQAEICITE